MTETIKEMYENITNIYTNVANNFITKSFNNSTVDYIKHSINIALKNHYPSFEFKIKVNFNEYNNSIILDIKPSLLWFDKISYQNYNSHDFVKIQVENTYFAFPSMECENCKLRISEDGNLIDGDFSCEEWCIKNILE